MASASVLKFVSGPAFHVSCLALATLSFRCVYPPGKAQERNRTADLVLTKDVL